MKTVVTIYLTRNMFSVQPTISYYKQVLWRITAVAKIKFEILETKTFQNLN